MVNVPPTMNRSRPIKMKIWAASMESNKYRRAPMHRSRMPRDKTLGIKGFFSRKVILYILASLLIVVGVYYIPDYFFLERMTADHTAFLLNALGVPVQSRAVGHRAFINEIQIVKDCTGIQVLAVFLGLLIPLPKASLRKKVFTILILSTILYGANLLRIGLEFWLVYFNILPWTLAHYPLSLLLGVLGVLFLILVTDHFLPEFGDFIIYVKQGAQRK